LFCVECCFKANKLYYFVFAHYCKIGFIIGFASFICVYRAGLTQKQRSGNRPFLGLYAGISGNYTHIAHSTLFALKMMIKKRIFA